jgi:hypothetical protein
MFDDYASLDALLRFRSGDISAVELVFGDRSGPSGRPLAMLSFLADQVLLGLPPERYKLSSLGLHLVNGLLVASLASFLLAETGTLNPRLWGSCCAVLWLLAPLQISTVLYLVQRMALLSAFFVLAALNLYAFSLGLARGRFASWLFRGMAVFLALTGVFAKENAIVALPLFVLLHNFVTGRRSRRPAIARYGRIPVAAGVITVAAVAALFFAHFAGGYSAMEFTPVQRMLTEARVLADYVTQAIWPDVSRLGIHHDDFILSKSWFEPSHTVAMVLLWSSAGLAALHSLLIGRPTMPAFALLFFLLAHSVESTFLALELYYEHRNYLPSFALFLLVTWAVAVFAKVFPEAAAPALLLVGFYAVAFALKLSSQVAVWSNPALLVINNVVGHPASPRVQVEYAAHVARQGALDEALQHSSLAHRLNSRERILDWRLRDFILHCYAGGRAFTGDATVDLPPQEAMRPIGALHTLTALADAVATGKCDRESVVDLLDGLAGMFLSDEAEADASAQVYSRLAALENTMQRYDNALEYALRYAEQRPDSITAHLMVLHFATAEQRSDIMGQTRAKLRLWLNEGRLSSTEEKTFGLYDED